MRVSELKQSKYLTKHDCGKGILLTVQGVQQENMAMVGKPSELKWCMYFHEDVKPMVLNTTKGQILQVIFGSDNSDDWLGKKLVAFHDPTITNMGQVVGGIGIRAPRGLAAQPQAVAQPRPQPAPVVYAPVQPTPSESPEDGGEADSDTPF